MAQRPASFYWVVAYRSGLVAMVGWPYMVNFCMAQMHAKRCRFDGEHSCIGKTHPMGRSPIIMAKAESDVTSITESEQLALQLTDLITDTPFAICNISTGMFSVARHYGAMKFQGQCYTYIPQHDECIRNDVLKWLTKHRKRQAALVAIERENEALQLDRCPNTGDLF